MNQKIIYAIAVLLVIGVFFYMRRGSLSGEEARRMVAGGARLVDVRTRAEFDGGHVAGAVNIPVQELERRMKELEPKDRPIVLYCQSGMRSARAMRMLKSAGFASVHNLGAMSRW